MPQHVYDILTRFNDPVALLLPPPFVFVAEQFPSSADLFMNLWIYRFEVKPGDALETEANGDKTPPIGLWGRAAALSGTPITITTIWIPSGAASSSFTAEEDASLSYCVYLGWMLFSLFSDSVTDSTAQSLGDCETEHGEKHLTAESNLFLWHHKMNLHTSGLATLGSDRYHAPLSDTIVKKAKVQAHGHGCMACHR